MSSLPLSSMPGPLCTFFVCLRYDFTKLLRLALHMWSSSLSLSSHWDYRLELGKNKAFISLTCQNYMTDIYFGSVILRKVELCKKLCTCYISLALQLEAVENTGLKVFLKLGFCLILSDSWIPWALGQPCVWRGGQITCKLLYFFSECTYCLTLQPPCMSLDSGGLLEVLSTSGPHPECQSVRGSLA